MTEHLLGFAWPAAVVGLLVALLAPAITRRGSALSFGWQAAVNVLAGVTVLLAGLWWFGVDGKMATYAALAAAIATSQWLCSRGWR